MPSSRKISDLFAIAGLIILFSSCNNTKYLPANESLYTGAEVNVEAPGLKRKKRKAIQKELLDLTRPIPNSSILGLRPKLWFWNIGANAKRKISVKKLIRKMGEPPVVLSDLNLENNNKVLQSDLENKGFFRASVTGETKIKKRRAEAIYTAVPGKQYIINEVKFQEDSSVLLKAINRTKRRTLLKKGEPFQG